MRLFIALSLPELILNELHEQQQKLKALGLIRGSYVAKSMMHLTLRYLGETDEEKLDRIKPALTNINFPAFSLSLGKVGFFEDEREFIRIIWAELIGEALLPLVAHIDRALLPIIGPRSKDFLSHVTLVRIRTAPHPFKLKQELASIELEPLSFLVQSFSLVRSELISGVRNYSELAQFKLISQ